MDAPWSRCKVRVKSGARRRNVCYTFTFFNASSSIATTSFGSGA
jgi:hypothetical protein